MLSQQHESTEDVSPIFDLGELSISNPIDRQPFVTSLRRSSSAVSAFGRSSFAVNVHPKRSEQISITVHQIWIQGESKLPDKFKKVVQRYRKLNESYQLWDHYMIRQLIEDHYPYLLEIYDNYQFWVMKVDLGKYVILHHYGGFYVDMDTIPHASLAPFALKSRGKITMEVVDDDWRVKFYYRKFVNNHFFYAPYRHDPFLAFVLTRVPLVADRPFYKMMMDHILGSIGPMFIMDCIEEYTTSNGGEVTLLSSKDVRPYFTHEGAVSWLSKRWFDSQDRLALMTLACLVILVYMAVKKHPR